MEISPYPDISGQIAAKLSLSPKTISLTIPHNLINTRLELRALDSHDYLIQGDPADHRGGLLIHKNISSTATVEFPLADELPTPSKLLLIFRDEHDSVQLFGNIPIDSKSELLAIDYFKLSGNKLECRLSAIGGKNYLLWIDILTVDEHIAQTAAYTNDLSNLETFEVASPKLLSLNKIFSGELHTTLKIELHKSGIKRAKRGLILKARLVNQHKCCIARATTNLDT